MSALRRLEARVRLVAGSVALGGVTALVLAAGLAGIGESSLLAAFETTFAFGGLWFGGGLLGWAGSVASGRAIEAAKASLEMSTDWTETRSRRAMARIGGFGGGMMGAAVVCGVVWRRAVGV